MIRPALGPIALCATLLIGASAHAEVPCPTIDGQASVYAIGSSTMGSVLGPMLKHHLKEMDVTLHMWGKASSGLARPDFHDWPKTAPRLMRKHKPDIALVSLGTNDFQSVFDKKKWIKWGDAEWEPIYSSRVDRLLAALGGKDKGRLIIWTGPTAFRGKNAEARAPVINRIMKDRVAAYVKDGGKAIYLDAWAKTMGSNGRPLSEAKLPGTDETVRIRTPDDIHLTADAVRALMARPILDAIAKCLPKPKEEATEAKDDGPAPTPPKADKAQGAAAKPAAETVKASNSGG